MYPLFEGNVDVQNDNFTYSISESCFEIQLNVVKSDDVANLSVNVKPEDDDGYELLVSYGVVVNGTGNYVDFDLWKVEEQVFSLPLSSTENQIKLEVEVHEILSSKSIDKPGPHRNFRVLTKNGELYVNATWLKENVGGSLFSDWYLRECQGESTVVPTNIGENELEILLKAVCSYSRIIVTKRSFDVLLDVAWNFKMVYLLRAIEHYLQQARSVHNMEKLIFAYKYKFAMLATAILAPLDSLERRKEALYGYLEEKSLTEIPHELLEMLDL
ncbi:unnamed protein product [Bursaphelenchus okinawaensis]|uniref:Uncharacterized protein n=1 Tax=Bursaphelenchus okinawaensis TaxID=465554 RepID=A0A811LH05_9BILA|nr:unnamed protein product [Bursaphelenchus okinawaensis]CAG9123272.1 unnamed protein product [Bursaphelenchus okinawaensis]